MSKSKNKMGYSLAVFLALALVGTVESAQAEVVVFNFTGVIANISGTPFGLSGIIDETPVKGTISYDTSLPLVSSFPPTSARYRGEFPACGMSVEIAGRTLQSQGICVFDVLDNQSSLDSFSGGFFPPFVVDGESPQLGSMLFGLGTTFDLNALISTELPLSLDVGRFSSRQGFVNDDTVIPREFLNFRINTLVVDECPNSDVSATVVIDGCNAGVTNTLFPTGCTISDLIAACAEGASNHGQFVSCVDKLTTALKKAGTITGQQKDAIENCAGQAAIP
jgi:hypothetical protein